MCLFDLTHTLGPQTPVFPGDETVGARQVASIESDGYRATRLEVGTHSGTHVDAPAHLLPDGLPIDALPLDLWIGPAVLVDAENLDPAHPPEIERLILAGCADGLSLEWARRLARSNVRLVGLDGPSLDAPGSRDLPCHRALLGAGVVLVENLRLAGVPRGKGTLYCLPLAVGAGDGAPARVLWRPRSERGKP